jgi:hypothetical protein
MLKITDGHAVSAKSARTVTVDTLKFREVGPVEYKSFQLIPCPFKKNFHPAVKDILRGLSIDKSCHGTFLQFLINGETMYAAGNPASAKERHKECAFGIALTITIVKYSRCGYGIVNVITEKDFITYIVIYGSDPFEIRKGTPVSLLNQFLN